MTEQLARYPISTAGEAGENTSKNSVLDESNPQSLPPGGDATPVIDRVSMVANIISTLLLRVAGRTSFVLLGFFLGEHFTSATMVALVLEAFYITELVFAPMVGSLSDRLGRKVFLVSAPLLGTGAALCLFAATIFFPHPDGNVLDARFFTLLGLILLGRLLEGATAALNTPACLGYITDTTVGSEKLRVRMMTAFEVATVGGLALAIPFGGQVSALLGTWGFFIVIGLHLVNVLLIAGCVRESRQRIKQEKHGSLFESLRLLREKRIFTFLPAWLSINALVGGWITLTVIMLTYPNPAADLRYPHQLLYGGFSKGFSTGLLGGFGLLFLVGMGLWTLVLPRFRRTTVMLIGLVGLVSCIVSLLVINQLAENPGSMTPQAYQTLIVMIIPLVVGVLLLSGFSPASLTQMAAISELHVGRRGAVMGLYSVVLGVGQLVGASFGGLAVDLGGFTGLMVFSGLLGCLSLGSVVYMRLYGHDLPPTGTKS